MRVSVAAAAAAALFVLAPAQADLYWCEQGNTAKLVQKQLSGYECRLVDKDPPAKAKSPASGAAKAPKAKAKAESASSESFPRVSASKQRERDLTRRQILEHELLEERRNLELAERVLRSPRARNDAGVEREFSYRTNNHELNIIAIQQELERLN